METRLYDRCLRCNKRLRTLKAKQRGYGDRCWKKQLQEQTEKYSLFKNVFHNNKTR